MRASPVGGDVQQGERISPAGQGQGDGAIDVALEPGGQTVMDRLDPGGVGLAQPGRRAGAVAAAGAAAQANWVRNWVARARAAALAVGA